MFLISCQSAAISFNSIHRGRIIILNAPSQINFFISLPEKDQFFCFWAWRLAEGSRCKSNLSVTPNNDFSSTIWFILPAIINIHYCVHGSRRRISIIEDFLSCRHSVSLYRLEKDSLECMRIFKGPQHENLLLPNPDTWR